ncbi:hypothetical protein [Luteolibacter luteus]|uniref:Uncharacterized protein n=1 Tax=Luteolibacter luteus TaxID=2728835 RepID=A0A858RFV9_9BACT|nr:hypothetical protein [Luteolibacter luteus]QJE95595.1 hypothetical protein HHL09_07270 [Luteolibacter luteus]
MQHWPIEVSDGDRIQDFMEGYASEDRMEHRSAIATLITSCLDHLFAQDEPIPGELFERIAAILAHHPQELGYWARGEEDSSLSWFSVTPWSDPWT